MILSQEYTFLCRSSAMLSQSGESNYYLLLYARAVPDAEGQTTTVSLRGVLASTNASSFYGFSTTCSASCNGQTVFTSSSVPAAAWELAPFEADGVTYRKGTVLCEAEATTPDATADLSLSWTLGSSSRTFTPAPQTSRTVQATVTLPPRRTAVRLLLLRDRAAVGSTLTVGLSAVPSGASCRIVWRSEAGESEVSANATASFSWHIPWQILSLLHASTVCGTLVCTTVQADGTSLPPCEEPFTLTVPTCPETRPVFSVTLRPAHNVPAPFASLYLQGKSRVCATVDARPVYGATVQSITMRVDTVPCASLTSPPLSRAGEIPITVTVTDSRGISNSRTETVCVHPYQAPYPAAPLGEAAPVCRRDSEDDTVLYIHARRVFSALAEAASPNRATLSYSVDGGTFTTLLPVTNTASSIAYASPPQTLSRATAHSVILRCEDDVGSRSDVTFSIPPCGCLLHLSANGRSMGIGRYSTDGDGTLSLGLRTHFHAPAVPRTLYTGTSWSELSTRPCPPDGDRYNLYLLTAGTRTHLLLRHEDRLTDGQTEIRLTNGNFLLVCNGTGAAITGLYALL